ncbi:unnamed protein product [Closterium sp. NIES-65]|nr:unnamed protein product [Closterium sp. NIES-65]
MPPGRAKSWSCSRKRASVFAVLPATQVALVVAALLSHSGAWIAVARGQTIAPSQGTFASSLSVLRRAAWGVTFNQWQEGGDCSQADGLTCDSNGMIMSMALDEMGLSGSLPTSLGSFINLSYLVLGFNQLTGSLLQGLSTLSRLSRLALGSNRFAGSLPDWIGGLSLMETLDVSRNNLSGLIPSSIGTLLNLTFLKKTSIPSVAFSAPFLLLLSILPHSITPITALPSIPPITALPSIPPITALPSIPPITALPSVTPMHAGASKTPLSHPLSLPHPTCSNVDNTSLVCPTTPASCEVPQDPLSVFCVDCATFCSQCSAAGKPLCFLPQLMSHLPVLKSFKDAIQPSSFGS